MRWSNEEYDEFKIGTKILLGIIIFIFIITAIFLVYKQFFGKMNANVETNIFHESNQHIESYITDLIDYEEEFKEANVKNDNVTKKAIIQQIKYKYKNFDADKIRNEHYKTFLNDVLDGKYDK